MHLLFMDESGTVVPKDKEHSKYFVIGGLIIPEIYWHEIDEKLYQLKEQYKITSEIKWRYFAPHNNDKTNGLKHLELSEKNKVRNELYNVISSYKAIKIIASVINVQAAYTFGHIKNQDDLYWWGYANVLTRFQDYLETISLDSGADFNGLVVIDNRLSCEDNRLRNSHYALLSVDKALNLSKNHLIEGLFIAPSHFSTGIQFADLVAGAIFRKYEKNDNSFFNQIEKSVLIKDGIIELPK